MTFEIIILALASTVRPTSLAAVYALLSSPVPRRLMIAYILAGLAFTIAFGLLVIWAFHGIDISSGSSHTRGVAELAGGILVVAFALCLLSGRIGGPRTDDAPRPKGRWHDILEQHLTVRTAAIAGPVTHIPGIFYLIALNVIVAADPKAPRALLAVLVYNAIWFAIPIGALAICIVAPPAARDAVGAINGWTRDHSRVIILVVSFLVGGALIVRGLLTI